MKILGYDYTLNKSADREQLENMGRCNTANQRIEIANNMNQQAQESTLLHEVIEALNFHLELKLEHTVISSLESGLYQVLTSNGVDLSPLLRVNP